MPTHDLTAPSTTVRPIDGLPGTLAPSTIAYPALARHMSSHQRTQGYVPLTLTSAFAPDGAGAGFAGVGTGARAALDAARAAAVSTGTETAAYSTSFEPSPPPASAHHDPQLAAARATAARTDAERNAPRARLRTVVLPHATLPRFLAIASANSARNLETCGLLLGREVVKGATPVAANCATLSRRCSCRSSTPRATRARWTRRRGCWDYGGAGVDYAWMGESFFGGCVFAAGVGVAGDAIRFALSVDGTWHGAGAV
ncbi:hypothetical protein B0H17DRAFT_1136497 [Mycena rosella]|uniref:Uncharacterized protein n=1 Tax=Mycena rosella TaxID=1033263 RepID=A0AAD7DAZ6_MYCRO|nr:hypothetical protein B0H17DRAFT_1136497 [Mycena rosella]